MTTFSVSCPHCRALLEVDADKEVVVGSRPAETPRDATSFEDRLEALAREKEGAAAKLAEAMRAEKSGAEIREERFKKLLDDATSSPVEKPVRDIDLD